MVSSLLQVAPVVGRFTACSQKNRRGTGRTANIGSIAETQLSFDAYGPLVGVGGPVMSPLDFPKKTVLLRLALRSCRMARRQ
jgi:hypothetical protein